MTKINKGEVNSPPEPAPKPRKTGRPCTICRLDALPEIDAALLRGEGFTDLSRRYKVNPDAVERHYTKHLPRAVRQEAAEAAVVGEGERGSTLLDDAMALRLKCLSLLAQAEAAGELDTALRAIREVARLIELQGKLMGQIDTSTTINVQVAPVLISLQSTMMVALTGFPEAKAAVLAALSGLGNGQLLIEG